MLTCEDSKKMVFDIVSSLLSPLPIVASLIIIVVYKLIIKHWNFFNKIGIKYVRGIPILGAQFEIFLGKKSSFQTFRDLYQIYSDEEVIGAYDLGGAPVYVINDVDITKRITSKDFDHFVNHRFQMDKNIDPLLGRSMFATNDQDWKDLRSVTSPAFTGKFQNVFINLDIHIQRL